MFVATMSKKGYTSDLTGSTEKLLVIPKDVDDDDTVAVDVKRLFSPIRVHILYTDGKSRILTLNKFNHAMFRVTKRLEEKIDRIHIYDTVEDGMQ